MSNNIEHWLKFFLVGVAETAANGKLTFEKIIGLRQRSEHKIMGLGKRAKIGQELLKHLYSQPIMNGFKRNRLFLFAEYLNLFSRTE
jgi:hypothetical protein